MSVICRKFLLKLALRTYTFLKRSHASTLSIWTKEIKAKCEEEPRKQQLTFDTFGLKTLGTHVIVLCQIQKFMLLYRFYFVLLCI